jgi:hypothetical protein
MASSQSRLNADGSSGGGGYSIPGALHALSRDADGMLTYTRSVYNGTYTVSTTGTVGSITGSNPWTATITNMTTTIGLGVGSIISATAGTGSLGGAGRGDVTVTNILSATSITVQVIGGSAPTAGTVTNIIIAEENIGANFNINNSFSDFATQPYSNFDSNVDDYDMVTGRKLGTTRFDQYIQGNAQIYYYVDQDGFLCVRTNSSYTYNGPV